MIVALLMICSYDNVIDDSVSDVFYDTVVVVVMKVLVMTMLGM